MKHDIGTIIYSLKDEPPKYGVWERIAEGRVLVGTDTGNPLLDIPQNTFGVADGIVPYHRHDITNPSNRSWHASGSGTLHDDIWNSFGSLVNQATSTGYAGTPENTTNSNYAPFYAVYIFLRTA